MGWDQHQQRMKAELETIRALSNDGSLNPALVLKWAQEHPESELYKSFEWDEAKAAHEFRLVQARALIQRFEVKMARREQQEPTEVRLVSVPKLRTRNDKGGSYLPVPIVKENPDWMAEVEQETLKNFLAWSRNKRDLCPNLEPIWQAIDEVADALNKEAAA